MTVYEGEENTLISLRAGTINTRWTIKPTSDELGTCTISDYGGCRDSTLTGLFYLNQSGLVIRNATTTDFGNPNSTPGLYIARCPNNTRTGVKILVVREYKYQLMLHCTSIQVDCNLCNLWLSQISLQ